MNVFQRFICSYLRKSFETFSKLMNAFVSYMSIHVINWLFSGHLSAKCCRLEWMHAYRLPPQPNFLSLSLRRSAQWWWKWRRLQPSSRRWLTDGLISWCSLVRIWDLRSSLRLTKSLSTVQKVFESLHSDNTRSKQPPLNRIQGRDLWLNSLKEVLLVWLVLGCR